MSVRFKSASTWLTFISCNLLVSVGCYWIELIHWNQTKCCLTCQFFSPISAAVLRPRFEMSTATAVIHHRSVRSLGPLTLSVEATRTVRSVPAWDSPRPAAAWRWRVDRACRPGGQRLQGRRSTSDEVQQWPASRWWISGSAEWTVKMVRQKSTVSRGALALAAVRTENGLPPFGGYYVVDI